MTDDEESVIASGKFMFGSTGLSVVGEPTFEEWDAVGVWLRTIKESIHWWIADWVNYGERRFGERASQGLSDERQMQAANATGWKVETVSQYARIGRQIAPENRDAGLTFSHHREVADLPAAEQVTWLTRAREEDWSTDRLRSELRATVKRDTSCWLLVRCASPEDRDALSDSLKNQGREVKLP